MRSVTTTTNVYKFSELSEEAKETAKGEYAGDIGYPWGEEALESIKALARHFGGKVSDWSVDWFATSYSSMSFTMPDDTGGEELKRLVNALGTFNPDTGKGNGDCVLTGCCTDEDAIDGLRIAYRAGERDLDTLMKAAFKSWLKAAQADCEARFEDDSFGEECDANNWEFTKDGHFFGHNS